MTVLEVVLYLFLLVMHVRAVMTREVLWKGRDEDVYLQEKKGKLDRMGTGGLEAAEKQE